MSDRRNNWPVLLATLGLVLSVLSFLLFLSLRADDPRDLMILLDGGRNGAGLGTVIILMANEASCEQARKNIEFVKDGEEISVAGLCVIPAMR